ncbi:MAG: DHH family phosphoesterase [Candidatus Anstonellales archaeon]
MSKSEFLRRCKEIRERVLSYKNPLIINHFDCDGIASGAITAIALTKMKKKYNIITVRKLDTKTIESAIRHSEKDGEVIFVDLGGASQEIDKIEEGVILDHHQTDGTKLLQANPHLFGFDGGTEISSSGVAYLVFGIRPDLAVVGAIGDMQYPLSGLNRFLLEEGMKTGEVQIKIDLRLYGRGSRPLAQMLEFADDPPLPHLSANPRACVEFLEKNGFWSEDKRNKSYYDLSTEEQKKFVDSLILFLAQGGNEDIAKQIIGEVYTFPKQDIKTELYDASDFSTLLNACGRHNKPEIGIGVCMGDKNAYQEASLLLAKHRKKLREGLSFASSHLQDFGKFLFLDARGVIDDGIIGVVAGMVLPPNSKKPIFAIATDDIGGIKVSARANNALVTKGLNLGLILKLSSVAVGGAGGGHKVAAGAQIPKEKLNDFLLKLNSNL